jgi:AbiV family abortive infection protein
MSEIDRVKPVVEAFLLNAERLLDAAKVVRKPSYKHISYHLATMALEEVGKAAMVRAGSIRPLVGNKNEQDEAAEDDRWSPLKWLENHERKLDFESPFPFLRRDPDDPAKHKRG